MIREAKVVTFFIDEVVMGLTKEFAANSSQWFNTLKDQLGSMDDAQCNSTVKVLLKMAIASGEVGSHVNQQTLEQILRGFVKLAKALTDATSASAYKKMAKSVARYIRNLWGSMTEEAKGIVGYAIMAGQEMKGIIALSFPVDKCI